MNHPNRRTRWAALASAVTLISGAVVAVQVGGATAAAAVPGYVRVLGPDSSSVPEPEKTSRAACPAGKRILGGGAWITDGTVHRAMLTRVEPVRNASGRDWFDVTAVANGETGRWSVRAYAICGNELPGLGVFFTSSAHSSSTFKASAAVCPAGRRTIGTGARVNFGSGQVGLQLSRASAPLDISRATAREDANGYSGNWSVTSMAVCANANAMSNERSVSTSSNSEGALATCPSEPNTFVHGPGGGGSLTDSGPFWLQVLWPAPDRRQSQVYMTGAPIGGVVSQMVCVS